MATNYKLTWVERGTSGRWRKRYRGQWLSYSGAGGKVASYQDALRTFKEDKLRIDNQLAGDNPLLIWIEQQQADILSTYCDSKDLRLAWQVLDDAKSMAQHLPEVEQQDSTPFGVIAAIKQRLRKKVSALLDGEMMLNEVGKPFLDRRDRPPLREMITVADLLDLQKRMAAVKQVKGEMYVPQSEHELEGILKPIPDFKQRAPSRPTALPPWERQQVNTQPTTIGELSVAYLADRKMTMEAGKLSLGRYDNTRQQVERFVAYAGSNTELSAINAVLLNSYRQQVAKESISDATKNERLRGVKDILRWASAMDFIADEPKIIRRGYSVEQTAKEIKLPSLTDVVSMLSTATDRVRLYALLALNTGMLQKDMSDLRRTEITLNKVPTIRRKRSKTSTEDNVPIVTYRLWKRTSDLLKQEIASDGELALLNEDGKPLLSDEIKANGKRKKLDCVDSGWDRLRRKTGKAIAFKMLRKLSASLLASHGEYGRYAQYFLGHAPDTTADRNYVVPSDAQFAKAVAWLESAIFDVKRVGNALDD